jgi:hypothetical protein
MEAHTTGLHNSERTSNTVFLCKVAVYSMQYPQVTDCTIPLFNMTTIRIAKHKFRIAEWKYTDIKNCRGSSLVKKKQHGQYAYNVTLWRVHMTVVAMEKQQCVLWVLLGYT